MASIPDVKIFPHATGKAAETVNQHQEPQELVFYAGWFCPYVQRSWIVLEEKSIPYQYKEINPYKKERHFLEINPKGLVPAVEYRGTALYESLILCEFFEEEFPEHRPCLLPSDATTRAIARIWIDHVTKAFVPAVMRLLQAQERDKQAVALQEVYDALRKFARQIKGPYFLGREFSLVDVAIAPWIVREDIIAEHRNFSRADVGEGWKEYADLVEKRESVARTMSDKEHLDEIYSRYLRDEAQSEAAKAIRSGKIIP